MRDRRDPAHDHEPPTTRRATFAAVVEDIAALGERNDWTVNGAVATYAPTLGGWKARVRAVRMAGHSYERLHIAIIDPGGVARFTCFASLLGEAVRVAESRVRAASAGR